MTARFIALEGGEGVGKSTQCRLLSEALAARGVDCIATREPGGTPGGEAIRRLLLDPVGQGWGAEAEALLFAAARADHVARLIRPALAAGKWVICDRFLDSSRAYQGVAGALGDAAVRELHRIGSGGLLPDLVLLFDLAPDQAAHRLAGRGGGKDRIEARNARFHASVAEAFRAFALAEPRRFATIDADGSPQAVAGRVLAAVMPLLGS